MPKVRIEIDQNQFNSLLLNGAFDGIKYELKEVIIEDDLFKDDDIYQKLKSDSIKAYKKMKEYSFNKLNNIRK